MTTYRGNRWRWRRRLTPRRVREPDRDAEPSLYVTPALVTGAILVGLALGCVGILRLWY